MEDNKIIVFENKHIRRIWFEETWFFSVVDVIGILTDSTNPSDYWYQLKKREKKNGGVDLSTNCRKMKMPALDGKDRPTDVADTEGVLRIVMSVPSPKAEPLKQWMAQVSTDRIIETENPELSFERMTELYKAKGYTDEWIMRRVESIKARKRLTDEWKNRGIKENKDFSMLTATIAKGTFGLNPGEHKALKGLEKPNQELRDHMTPLELIFTALSEETTRIVAIKEDAQGYNENHAAATKGGQEVGTLRKDYERRMGIKVISNENFLNTLKEGSENTEDNKT